MTLCGLLCLQTLDVPNKYFKGTSDEGLNAEFVKKVLALEKEFERRNADPGSWTRWVLATGFMPKGTSAQS